MSRAVTSDGDLRVVRVHIATFCFQFMQALGPSQALYSDVATAFHSIMTHDHSYATGNGNHGEYWGTPG